MPLLSCHIYSLPPLKSECKDSCKCRCILPVCWGYKPDSREHGMLQHEAFGLWCCSGKPLILTAASSAVLLVCLFQLGWNSDSVGSRALWAWLAVQPGSEDVPQCQPSVDCLHRAWLFSSLLTIRLLAGKSLMQVVVSTAGGCMRMVTSRDRAAWQTLRRGIRDFSRGQHQNWGCGNAWARSLDGPAGLLQLWWSDHSHYSWAVDTQELQWWVWEEFKNNKEIP